jgi:hypothetical protein
MGIWDKVQTGSVSELWRGRENFGNLIIILGKLLLVFESAPFLVCFQNNFQLLTAPLPWMERVFTPPSNQPHIAACALLFIMFLTFLSLSLFFPYFFYRNNNLASWFYLGFMERTWKEKKLCKLTNEFGLTLV